MLPPCLHHLKPASRLKTPELISFRIGHLSSQDASCVHHPPVHGIWLQKKDFRITSLPGCTEGVCKEDLQVTGRSKCQSVVLNYRRQGDWTDVDKRDTIWTSHIPTSNSQLTYLQSARLLPVARRSIQTDDMLSLKLMVTYIYVSIARGSDPPYIDRSRQLWSPATRNPTLTPTQPPCKVALQTPKFGM